MRDIGRESNRRIVALISLLRSEINATGAPGALDRMTKLVLLFELQTVTFSVIITFDHHQTVTIG